MKTYLQSQKKPCHPKIFSNDHFIYGQEMLAARARLKADTKRWPQWLKTTRVHCNKRAFEGSGLCSAGLRSEGQTHNLLTLIFGFDRRVNTALAQV